MSDDEDENKDDKLDELNKLITEREKKVLKMRFGIDVSKDEALKKVAREFDVTRERIREIEEKALKKLRGKKNDEDD